MSSKPGTKRGPAVMVRTQFAIDSAQRSIGNEGAGERLGVGERHLVAGALDQRVLRVSTCRRTTSQIA